ncbi:MAG TPA: PilZ domain-containing protein [Geobacteraceae bacterium]
MDAPNRRFPRISKLCLIAYVNHDGAQQRTPVSLGRVLDISPAGIGMEVFTPVTTGSVMEMEIDLQDILLAVQGKVVHVRPAEEGRYLVGIEFAETQELLVAP